MDTEKIADSLTPAFASLTAEEVAERLLNPWRGLGGWLKDSSRDPTAAYVGDRIIDLANGELTRADALELVRWLREGGEAEYNGKRIIWDGFCPGGKDTGGWEPEEEYWLTEWKEIAADLRWIEDNAQNWRKYFQYK